MDEFFIEFGALFTTFGWWSLLLISATVAIMYPINVLWKKVMQKDDLSRLRKIVAFISVYIVSFGLVAIFTAIFSSGSFADSKYLFSSTLALGFCSQVVWELVKVIRDYGFKQFVSYISEKVDWKKAVKQVSKKYNVNAKFVDEIISQVEKIYITDETTAKNVIIDNEMKIVNDIYDRLKPAVREENLTDAAQSIYELIRDCYVEETQTVEESQTAVEQTNETVKDEEYIEIK